ncbi:MAG: Rieske 2Fe-2S domain-containing protein [Planctomycetota bacterium]|nr:Rieske 2Fe-2S domain-containing protein [Planctomycetota bacterium]
MNDFVRLTEINNVPDPGQAYFEVEDRMVVLFHVDGQFYCLDDVCTHDGGPLGEGTLAEYTIACPRHGAKFDIRTGQALSMPANQPTRSYEVRIDAGVVYVRVAGNPTSASPPATTSASATALSTASTSTSCTANSPCATLPCDSTSVVELSGGQHLTEDAVREEMKKVIDPELFVNIVDLGLVYVVDLHPGTAPGQTKVLIEMTMTSPACPAGPQLIQNSKMTVGNMPGVESVEVKIVMDPPWTPDRMTEAARDHLGIF